MQTVVNPAAAALFGNRKVFDEDTFKSIADSLKYGEYSYADLKAQGDALGDDRYCTVIATAVVMGLDFASAGKLLSVAGRRFKFGCADEVYRKVVRVKFGLQDVTKFYEGHSIRALAPLLPDTGMYLVNSHKHVSAVRDGVLEDWSVMNKLYVKRVFKVVDKDMAQYPASPERRKRSVVVDYEKPTKAVHAVCEILYEQEDGAQPVDRRWRGMFRAKVSAECVANGINPTTAAVQTGKWFKNTFGA